MAFGLSKSGKQVFTANGTWVHPMPGVELSVTMLLVGGGGGGQGAANVPNVVNGGNGGNTTATPAGGSTITAKGGAGGGETAISGAGRTTQNTAIGPAGVGIYGMNGSAPTAPWYHGQSGGVTVITITTAGNIALKIGAGGTAGTGAKPGESGLAIVEW